MITLQQPKGKVVPPTLMCMTHVLLPNLFPFYLESFIKNILQQHRNLYVVKIVIPK